MAWKSHVLGVFGLVPAGLVTLGLMAGMFAIAPASVAGVTKCQAKNVTQGTKESPILANLITAANPGDTIQVKGTCVGNFTVAKDLNLLGKPTKAAPSPTLAGPGTGAVLSVGIPGQFIPGLDVTLTGLTITGGRVVDAVGAGIRNLGNLTLTSSSVTGNSTVSSGGGGGIYSAIGTLTLISSSVTGNSAIAGGGIYLASGSLTLTSTSVTANSAYDPGIYTCGACGGGGGIAVSVGTVSLNGSSSVSGNAAVRDGGGIYKDSASTLTLNDSSSVSGNRADFDDNGIGTGGGVYGCVTGAVDGGNVNSNYQGTGTTVDNISNGCG